MLPGPVSKAKTSRSRAAGNHGDVGDAADVERGAAASRMSIEQVIHPRHQRRALAADGHVGGAKVGDGGDAGEGGDHGRLANLQRGGDARAEK